MAILITPKVQPITIQQDETGALRLVGEWPEYTEISDELILVAPVFSRRDGTLIIRLDGTAARYRVTEHDDERKTTRAMLEAWV